MNDLQSLKECIDVAKRVKALHDDGIVNTVRGIDGATVLLNEEAFYRFFSVYDIGDIWKSGDKFCRIMTAVLDGVKFECVEFIDELGSE